VITSLFKTSRDMLIIWLRLYFLGHPVCWASHLTELCCWCTPLSLCILYDVDNCSCKRIVIGSRGVIWSREDCRDTESRLQQLNNVLHHLNVTVGLDRTAAFAYIGFPSLFVISSFPTPFYSFYFLLILVSTLAGKTSVMISFVSKGSDPKTQLRSYLLK